MRREKLRKGLLAIVLAGAAGCAHSINQVSDAQMTELRMVGENIGYQTVNADGAFLRGIEGNEIILFRDPSGADEHRGGYVPEVDSGKYGLFVIKHGKKKHVRDYVINKEEHKISILE